MQTILLLKHYGSFIGIIIGIIIVELCLILDFMNGYSSANWLFGLAIITISIFSPAIKTELMQ